MKIYKKDFRKPIKYRNYNKILVWNGTRLVSQKL
jgi:hypothetical protein